LNTDRLKALNKPDNPLIKPENLMEEYQIKVPLYGIPPEVFNTLVLMMTEIAKYQAPMQDKIKDLPTWEDWMTDIQPTVEKAMNGHIQAVRTCENNLRRDFQNQTDSLRTSVTKSVMSKLTDMETRLQARDNTSAKLRWKWIGIGAMLPILLSGLLWLLSTFWL